VDIDLILSPAQSATKETNSHVTDLEMRIFEKQIQHFKSEAAHLVEVVGCSIHQRPQSGIFVCGLCIARWLLCPVIADRCSVRVPFFLAFSPPNIFL